MTNDFVKQGYNNAAADYIYTRNQFENTPYLEKLTNLLSPGSLVLDIGCGGGQPVDSYLISKGHKVLGIDISEKVIALAKQQVPEGDFKVKDMSTLYDGEYSVDAVVSFYAIFHTPRETHKELLKKIHSFIKDNGFLLITMGANNWEGKEANFHGTEMYWSHYDAKTNSNLVQQVGFTIVLDEIDASGGEKHQIILAKKL